MSGTGRSTLLVDLGRRVIESWTRTTTTGLSMSPFPDGSGMEQLWREDRIGELLAGDGDVPLFVAGCTAKQSKFYDRFDAMVLLTAPKDVLLERIATTSPLERNPAERSVSSRILRP